MRKVSLALIATLAVAGLGLSVPAQARVFVAVPPLVIGAPLVGIYGAPYYYGGPRFYYPGYARFGYGYRHGGYFYRGRR
jgi:hypothetical protein